MLEKALEMYRDYLYEKLDEVFEGTGDSGIKNHLFRPKGTTHKIYAQKLNVPTNMSIDSLMFERKKSEYQIRVEHFNISLDKLKHDSYQEGYCKVIIDHLVNFEDCDGYLLFENGLDYDVVGDVSDGYILVKKNNRYNFLDLHNQLLFDNWLEYDYVGEFHEGFAKVQKDGLWNFIDKKGNLLTKEWISCDDMNTVFWLPISRAYSKEFMRDFHDGCAIFKKNGVFNYLDTQGIIHELHIKQGNASYIYDYHEGYARVMDGVKYSHWNFVDKEGNLLYQDDNECYKGWLLDDYVGDFHEGYALVKRNKDYSLSGYGYRWNLIDHDGKKKYSEDYVASSMSVLTNGLSLIEESYGKSKYCVDINGNKFKEDIFYLNKYFAAQKRYDSLFNIKNYDVKMQADNILLSDYITKGSKVNYWLKVEDTYYYIDGDRRIKIEKSCSRMYLGKGHYALIERNGKWYAVDEECKPLKGKCKDFDFKGDYQEGYALVQKDALWNFQDESGKLLFDKWLDYDFVGEFHEGYALVMKNGLWWNFIDKKGNLLLDRPCKGKMVSDFSNGFAIVLWDNIKISCSIDINGNIYEPEAYFLNEYLLNHDEKNFWIQLWKYYYYIDDDKKIKPLKYCSRFHPNQNGNSKYMVIERCGKWNFIDEENNFLFNNWLIYDSVTNFCNGYAIVEKLGLWNFIDEKGNLLFKEYLRYEKVHFFYEGYALVELNEQFNYIDKEGNLLCKNWINVHAFNASHFRDGCVKLLGQDGECCYLNRSGEWILQGKESDMVEENLNFLFHEGDIICKNIDMKNYEVKKHFLNFKCQSIEEKCGFSDTYYVKYQPIKRYSFRYTLCLDNKTIYLFDRISKNYLEIGDVHNIEYDDYFIFDKKNGKIFFVYDNKIIDITDYYYHHLIDKEHFSIKSCVGLIYNLEEFIGCRYEEYKSAYQEERDRMAKKLNSLASIIKEKDLEELKKRLEANQQYERERERLITLINQSKSIFERQCDEFNHGSNSISRTIDKVEKVKNSLQELQDTFIKHGKCYSVHMPIIEVLGVRKIDPDFFPYIKVIDWRYENFDNADLKEIDFRGTNIIIGFSGLNPQCVHNKDLHNSNFEGVYIEEFASFQNVDIRGSHFGYFKSFHLKPSNDFVLDDHSLEIFNLIFHNSKFDEKTTFSGVPFSVIFKKYEEMKAKKEDDKVKRKNLANN